MGLVQAQEHNITPETKQLSVGSTTIIWNNDIESLYKVYGTLVIDFYKMLFGSTFIVNFERSTC